MNLLLFELVIIAMLFRCTHQKGQSGDPLLTTTEDPEGEVYGKGAPTGQNHEKACENAIVSEADVVARILANYTKSVRPLKHANRILNVTVSLALKAINEIKEKEQLMILTGHVTATWFNEYFVWRNIPKLRCVDSIYLPAERVFLPDLAVINTHKIYEIVTRTHQNVIVTSDGRCSYFPEITFTIHCHFDFTQFPFDKQSCPMKIESWLSMANSQRFIIGRPAFTNNNMTENEQWKLQKVTVHHYNVTYEKPNDVYDGIEFRIYVSRRTSYYILNIIGPAIILACVEIFTFSLPTTEVHKVGMGFTCLLSYTMFQTLIVKDLPRTSHTPSLTIFVIMQMACIALALFGLASVFIFVGYARLAHEVPEWLYNAATWIGRMLGMHLPHLHKKLHNEADEEIASEDIANLTLALNSQDPSGHFAVSQQQLLAAIANRIVATRKRKTNKNQWLYIAKVADRLTFYLYLIGLICTPAVMFVSVAKNDEKEKKLELSFSGAED